MSEEDLLESIADDFLKVMREGKSPPSIDYYVRKCPQLESEIRDLLFSLHKMEKFSSQETQKKKLRAASSVRRFQEESLGDFEIVREIGRGGMGTVFLAADRVLDRRVALKVLSGGSQSSDSRVERFRREAKLASRLHHTNIVPVFGVGQEGEHLYYAMQFIDGVDLRRILTALGEHDGSLDMSASLVDQAQRLIAFDLDTAGDASDETAQISTGSSSAIRPGASSESSGIQLESSVTLAGLGRNQHYWNSIAKIGVQVCDALQYAHKNGILHRDIKPSNLLMDRSGTVWVTDFGLAKLQQDDDFTRSGDILGTLRYMAPEQLEGQESPSSDIYALGLTLYELLTQRSAHQGTSYRQLLEQKSQGQQTRPRSIVPEVPRDLETIVLKALNPEAVDRYTNAAQMQEDLERFLEDRPILAKRTTVVEHTLRWCRRNKAVASLLVLVGCLSLALPVGLSFAYQQEAQQRARAEQSLHIALDGLDEIISSFMQQEDGLESDFVSTGSSGVPLRLTPESGRFLERMLQFYDQLAAAEEGTASPRLQAETARAFRRVADIHQSLGAYSEAIDAYAEAEKRYLGVSNQTVVEPLAIEQIHMQLGRVYLATNQIDRAKKILTTTLGDLEKQDSQASKLLQTQVHLLLAKSRPSLPMEHAHVPGGRRGPRRFGMGFDFEAWWRERFASDGPPPFGPPGKLESREGRRPGDREREEKELQAFREQSEKHANAALNLLATLIEEQPESSKLLYLKALCLQQLAGPELVGSEKSDGKKEEAIRLLRELIAESPQVARYRFELSQTLRDVDVRRIGRGNQAAIDQLDEARELSELLVQEHDQVALYRINLAHIYANMGMLYERQRDFGSAEYYSRYAVDSHRYVAENFPGLKSISRSLMAGPSFALARMLQDLQRNLDAMLVLVQLESDLEAQIADSTVSDALRQKAKRELEFCHQMQDRIPAD